MRKFYLTGKHSQWERKLSFNGDEFFLWFSWFCFFLWNEEFQDTVFELSFDILFCNIFSNIESSLAGSGVTLTTKITSGIFLLFVLIQTFCCTDGHVTVFQFSGDFIFLKARKIHL